jgi:hypothetical protein
MNQGEAPGEDFSVAGYPLPAGVEIVLLTLERRHNLPAQAKAGQQVKSKEFS